MLRRLANIKAVIEEMNIGANKLKFLHVSQSKRMVDIGTLPTAAYRAAMPATT